MFTNRESKRIFSKVFKDPVTHCWNWCGDLNDGYGRIYWRGKRYKAHRLFYLWKYNELPEWNGKSSKELHHICNNRACVNPSHLKLVSVRKNVLAGFGPTAINSKKVVCAHGHSSFIDVLENGTKRRRCLECDRIYMRSDKRREYKRRKWRDWKEQQADWNERLAGR